MGAYMQNANNTQQQYSAFKFIYKDKSNTTFTTTTKICTLAHAREAWADFNCLKTFKLIKIVAI
jgi:hypothetical protein